jgi:hypothetical protein
MTKPRASAISWWRPDQDRARRRWIDVLQEAGVERARVLAALAATAARLHLTESEFAEVVGLQPRWLPRPPIGGLVVTAQPYPEDDEPPE